MFSFLAIFAGGGIGSVARWLICSKINNHWGTMLVNVIGAFLIGVCYVYCSQKINLRPEVRQFLSVGLLGGFTTFSTYLLDFSTLLNRNEWLEAVLYLCLSIFIGVLFLVLGMKLVQGIG